MRQLAVPPCLNISKDMSNEDVSIAKGISPETVAGIIENAPNSTLILDSRPFMAFNANHITKSVNVHCPPILKRRSNGFVPLANLVPCERRRKLLEDGQYCNVVVCDSDTTDLTQSARDSNLYSVLKSLRQQVELGDVSFLIGGFDAFEMLYPNMCAGHNNNNNTNINTPCSLILSQPGKYRSNEKCGPVEILPGLYLGDSQHSSQQETLRNLGITSLLNVSTTCKNFFENDFEYMNIPVNDNDTADISVWFNEAINFIDNVRDNDGKVLVHCQAGISRSATICIAYIISKNNYTLEQAFDHVRARRRVIAPNLNFMRQLQLFEKDILGAQVFDVPDSVSSISTSLASVEFDFSCSTASSSDYSASSSAFDFSFQSPAVPPSPSPIVSPS